MDLIELNKEFEKIQQAKKQKFDKIVSMFEIVKENIEKTFNDHIVTFEIMSNSIIPYTWDDNGNNGIKGLQLTIVINSPVKMNETQMINFISKFTNEVGFTDRWKEKFKYSFYI